MPKKTIKLNNEAKLVLESSYNEVNDAIIKAMISYKSHEQYDLGYVVTKSYSNMCETGYFCWDDQNVYLCDDCDNCYQIFNFIEKQYIKDKHLSQYTYKRRFK